MPTPQELAKSIVKESLRPKEYEVVAISTYPHTIDLAEQVAIACQKAGADPITLLETDELFYGQYKNYSLDNLRKTSAHCLGLAEYVRSYIWLGGPKDPGRMANVPKEKWEAANEGEQAHYDRWLETKPKSVGVSIGQVTRERAGRYGFSYATWKRNVEESIAINYRQMGSLGQTVAGLLSSPVDVHVTADNGTDLKFRLAGTSRRARVNDGIISDQDLANDSRDASLPAGDVSIAAVEDSAEGTFVSNVKIPQMGKLIEGLAWTFEDGRITDFTAKKNLNLAQTNWESGTGAKDMFGGAAFGLNPKAKAGYLHNNIVGGAMTLFLGDNRMLDGANKSTYAFFSFHSAPIVEIAGKTVIENGAWTI